MRETKNRDVAKEKKRRAVRERREEERGGTLG